MRHSKKLLFFVLLSIISTTNYADWASLDNAVSSVSFVSVKNKDIAEINTFDSVVGSISETGKVQISIDAASVNTGIGIRDERLMQHLFSVANYPNIVIEAQVDLNSIEHGAQRVQLPATLSLLGKQHSIELDVLATKHKTEITVSSAKPVLMNASQAGLTQAIAKLAELAGGVEIGHTVPVSFTLSFTL